MNFDKLLIEQFLVDRERKFKVDYRNFGSDLNQDLDNR